MDFETLGEALVSVTLDDDELYVSAADGDIQTGTFDLEKAKGFLSTVNPRLNVSLYDHLADVLKSVLRYKIPDAVEKIEELSSQVKNLRQKAESDLTEHFEIAEEIQKFIAEKQVFYKFKTSVTDTSEAIKTAEDDEEESDEEENDVAKTDSEELAGSGETIDLADVLPDLRCIMGRFHEAGIGLSPDEEFELCIALKDLAVQHKLRKVKFWGKILGIKNDYYIAEAPYQEGVVQEKFGWEVSVEEKETDEEEPELLEKDNEEDEEVKNEDDPEEETGEVETEETATVKVPPIPEPKQKVKKKIPPESNGKGVNEYLYFACTKIGDPWHVLPYMLPSHVSEARYLKRFFTGDLESQVRGCVPYPGKEAHYLRAQIARITASTCIAPNGYYKKAGEKAEDEDEEEDEEDEESENDDMVLNTKYVPKAIKYMYSDGLNAWSHCRRAILDQGRCIPMKLGEKADDEESGEEDDEKEDEDDDNEEKEEPEEPEILEAIVETEVPLLRSLTEDKGIARLKPWTWKLSSKLLEEKAVLVLCSNIWPGAYTFYDGKNFEHIYIGYAFKYSVFHYAPPIRVSWQGEYVGDDVTEHVDEEIFPKDDTEDEDAEEKPDEEEAEAGEQEDGEDDN